MGDLLIMSDKERSRKAILEGVRLDYFSLKDAAQAMELSYRQAKRLWKRYCTQGDKGLVHRSRGSASSRKLSAEIQQAVIARYKERYYDFGPTFALEKLVQDGFSLSVETLRKWLKEAGLWHIARKRKQYRQMRERKKRFGELVQIDGSIHDWFENGKKDCLLNMVDDATGISLGLIDTGESTYILLSCLLLWIEKYGIPAAVYVDLKNVYISPSCLKGQQEDDKQHKEGMSVFQRVCKQLDIIIVKAYSAQAKGRVERKHGVYQDRFIKELRLRDIKTIPKANAFLLNGYLDELNERFSIEPVLLEDAHRTHDSYDLGKIFCWEFERTIRNDWTIQFDNRYYQLEKASPIIVRPGIKIWIRKALNGDISLWHKKDKLAYKVLAILPKKKGLQGASNRIMDTFTSYQTADKYPWIYFNLSEAQKPIKKRDHYK